MTAFIREILYDWESQNKCILVWKDQEGYPEGMLTYYLYFDLEWSGGKTERGGEVKEILHRERKCPVLTKHKMWAGISSWKVS